MVWIRVKREVRWKWLAPELWPSQILRGPHGQLTHSPPQRVPTMRRLQAVPLSYTLSVLSGLPHLLSELWVQTTSQSASSLQGPHMPQAPASTSTGEASDDIFR